jgi:hypothetical protein
MMNPLSVICNHICCIVTATRWRWLWRWGNLSIVLFGCCLAKPSLWLDSSDFQWTCFCISSNTSNKFKHYQLFVNSLTSTCHFNISPLKRGSCSLGQELDYAWAQFWTWFWSWFWSIFWAWLFSCAASSGYSLASRFQVEPFKTWFHHVLRGLCYCFARHYPFPLSELHHL